MELLSLLTLRIIITFLSVGSTQMYFCSSMAGTTPDFQMQSRQSHHRWSWESNQADDGNVNYRGNDGDEAEDPNDGRAIRLYKGPTEYPLDFNKPDFSKQMSFRQAVVLAREEAKCFSEFGSRTNKTVEVGTSSSALAQRLVTPSGCFQPEMEAQCQQCKNITAQPITTLDECHHICDSQDMPCKRMCVRVYNALRNSAAVTDNFGQNSASLEENDVSSNDNRTASSSNSSRHMRSNDVGSIFSPSSPSLGNDRNLEGKKEHIPLVYVIEQKSGNRSEWKTIGKTPFGLQAVNVSYHSDVYKWRITAVGPNGIEDEAVTESYVTLNGFKSLGPPKKIYVAEAKVKNSSVDVLIGWEPPAEKACFYKIVLEGTMGIKLKTKTVRIKDQPLGRHMYWFENLNFGATYHVRMTSRDPSWIFESNLTKLEFKTPTCLDSFNYRFDKCAPPSPRNIQSEVELAKGDQHVDEPFLVTLAWLPPFNTSDQNRIEKYLVEISSFTIYRPAAPKINSSGETQNPFPVPDFRRHNYTIFGNTTTLTVRNLTPDTEYTVMITAYSIKGPSPRAQYQFNTKMVKAELSQETTGNWIYVTVTFIISAALLLFCNVMRIYVHKRNVKIARNQYFQSMEERDDLGADWSIVPLTEDSSNWKLFDENFPKEKWEIAWDDMTMGEVIGQGAFGVVRRAKVHRKKLEAKLKIRGDDETWFNSADRHTDETDPEMETVAVKMVKVSSTRDDREQLIKEITMMQSLGFHSQIVGLLGACTKGRNLCLVLEYCPGGDLLTFVRKVRAKYWPTLGLSGASMPHSPFNVKRGITAGMQLCGHTNSGGSGGRPNSFSSGNDNRKSVDSSPINYADIGGFSASCSSPEDSSPGFNEGVTGKRDCTTGNSAKTENNSIPPFFVNGSHEDEFDEDDEFRPIDEKDVLSYARQIAMGMEYLEKNKVVHRDLACRNVLLMGDYKHVKISDFGLSRDIYTWNVYHQKSNGKLPIKWMAIESIFTHVFTTKSDVWSYGILLWELLTLGGTPYPGLGNTELFHLLKSGYRMERPDNCSEELYAVMKKCWRTAAASRPSFTELRRHVETMMEAAEPNLYLSLMADIPVDYFQLSSRSDIPLVGKGDESGATPLRDSPSTNSSTNPFSSRQRHNSSFSTGTHHTNPMSSETEHGGGSSTKKIRTNEVVLPQSTRRKSHSLYHNTSFSRQSDGLPNSQNTTTTRFIEQTDAESCLLSSHQKEYENKEEDNTTTLISADAANASPSTSSTLLFNCSGDDDSNLTSVLGGKRTVVEGQLPPEPNHRNTFTGYGSHSSPSGTGSPTVINGNGIQRLPFTNSNKSKQNTIEKYTSQKRASLQSPNLGEIENDDWVSEQVSLFSGETENVFEEEVECGCGGGDGGGERSSPLEGHSCSLTKCRSLDGESRGTSRLPEYSCSFKKYPVGNKLTSMPPSQTRPKLTLPFVNVNDMTIIENRTYDLRDT